MIACWARGRRSGGHLSSTHASRRSCQSGVFAGPGDPLGRLASTGMGSTSCIRPSPRARVVGRRPDGPRFRAQGQNVEGGALTLRRMGHGGKGTAPDRGRRVASSGAC